MASSGHLPTFLEVVRHPITNQYFSDPAINKDCRPDYQSWQSNRPCDLNSDTIPDDIKELARIVCLPSTYDHNPYYEFLASHEDNLGADEYEEEEKYDIERLHFKHNGNLLYDIATYQLTEPQLRHSLDFEDPKHFEAIQVLAIIYELIFDQHPLYTFYNSNLRAPTDEFEWYVNLLINHGFLTADQYGNIKATGKVM